MSNRRLFISALIGTSLLVAGNAQAFTPRGKVDCLAPADPSGGWDFTCRSVGSTLEKLHLVPRSVQTINPVMDMNNNPSSSHGPSRVCQPTAAARRVAGLRRARRRLQSISPPSAASHSQEAANSL